MGDEIVQNALQILCRKISAGEVRRENLRTEFWGIAANLMGVSPASMAMAQSFMPPMFVNAILEKVDALWDQCQRAGVGVNRDKLNQAFVFVVNEMTASINRGERIEEIRANLGVEVESLVLMVEQKYAQLMRLAFDVAQRALAPELPDLTNRMRVAVLVALAAYDETHAGGGATKKSGGAGFVFGLGAAALLLKVLL